MISPQSDIRASVSSSTTTAFGAGKNGGGNGTRAEHGSAENAHDGNAKEETNEELCDRYAATSDLDWPAFCEGEIRRLYPRKMTKGALDGMRKEGKRRRKEREKAEKQQSRDNAERNAEGPEIDDGGYISFGRHRMERDKPLPGLYFAADERPVFVCGLFRVLAETRDSNSQSWGLQLECRDRDTRTHRLAIPKADLVGDGSAVKRRLADVGLDFGWDRGATDHLLEYLLRVRTDARTTAVMRCGWHDTADGPVYVLPERTIGETQHSEIVLQSDLPVNCGYAERGTVEEWRDSVASLAKNNSRLTFAISAAFAGVLLDIVSEDGGGINFEGPAKIGKTTTLRMSVSVWGPAQHMHSWRATTNGLEGMATAHSDNVYFLDEMGSLDARDAGAAVYMLANGEGKARARRDGNTRPPAQWRLLFLSTGEVGITARLNEIGQKAKAGQEVRLAGVPVDAGKRMGAFEDLHDAPSPDDFATRIRSRTSQNYGTAGPAFVHEIVKMRRTNSAELKADILAWRKKFFDELSLGNAAGQVSSVASRFAIIAAAGELATAADLTGWSKRAAFDAAVTCFKAWLGDRSVTAMAETISGIAQVRAFIAQHGDSRFQRIGRDAEDNGNNAEPETYDGGPAERRGRVMINRVGFRRKVGESYEYLFLPEPWRDEVCKGWNPTRVARDILSAGHLKPELHDGKDGKVKHLGQRISGLPGFPARVRCYVVSAEIMDAGDDAEPGNGGVNG
jgi:putative DNA primase/helicase